MTRTGILVAVLAAAAMLVAAPFVLPSYFLTLLIKALIFALFAMSFDILVGYLGLASLGHAAFFGISAYAVALLAGAGLASPLLQILLGLFAAVVLALIFGPLSLRARGVYHFMITLALAQVLWSLAFGWRSLTGGDDGLTGIRRPEFGFGGSETADIAFYFFVLILSAVGMLALAVVVRSPLGRVFVGIRENEQRMMVLGYNVALYQVAGIVIAAVGAGLAGILYAYATGFVGVSYLGISLSAEVLLMVIVGGAGTLVGPAVGAFALIALQVLISSSTQQWVMFVGLIYVATVLWAPKGIIGMLAPSSNWRPS